MAPVLVCDIIPVVATLVTAPVKVMLPLPVWFSVPALLEVPVTDIVPVPPRLSVVFILAV